jgi:hypothetical protein
MIAYGRTDRGRNDVTTDRATLSIFMSSCIRHKRSDIPARFVNDPDLTLNEKRAILASWASDACAVKSAPALRLIPGNNVVSFDEVIDALRSLDAQVQKTQVRLQGGFKRHLRRRRRPSFRARLGGLSLH